jgi:menaquinone-dependent protoporphyrinogen IX oxidase
MNILVVYKSLSGFTEKYAKWIAEDLQATCIELQHVRSNMIDENTIIVFGGSLHAIGINGYKHLKKIIKNCRYKELILFAVGASPKKVGIENELIAANFKTKEEKENHLFYLRGGFDYSKLDIWNKMLMTLLKIKIKSKTANKRTGDESGMLASYEKPLDATRRENVNDIVLYIRQTHQAKRVH